PAFLRRLLQRRRESGTYSIRPHAGGRQPRIRGSALKRLERVLQKRPSATIQELCDVVGGVSSAAMCRTLHRLGWTVKRGRYKQQERAVFRSPLFVPVYQTALGELYEADCLCVLPKFASESFDLAFCDPPFNLRKRYGSK